ncbi:hypothetical protein cyc_06932 [Cyclospora cayetanensis]|uniref:Uncharacterized protein n=1 Tax=Cyclospora cayetanensis TaxID=88456 RepID=A0A1D3D221_9EIME|nr:hypothetical protein cyc_06932 [Cyclospora cayetanensis]
MKFGAVPCRRHLGALVFLLCLGWTSPEAPLGCRGGGPPAGPLCRGVQPPRRGVLPGSALNIHAATPKSLKYACLGNESLWRGWMRATLHDAALQTTPPHPERCGGSRFSLRAPGKRFLFLAIRSSTPPWAPSSPGGCRLLSSLKRPYYVIGEDGKFQIESRQVGGCRLSRTDGQISCRDPPPDAIFEGWADLVAEEERLWGSGEAAATAAEEVVRGERPLTIKDKVNERILKGRKALISEYAFKQPLSKHTLWIVTPKQGTQTRPTLKALRLCALPMGTAMGRVAHVRPFPGTCRIFYARGATLQYRVRPRFRTICPLLEKDERLQQKYGGAACPGLFPTWDESGILEEVDECMNRPPPDMESYPVNLEWDNVAGLSPENQDERPWWYNNVHYPTRQAVQRAFEEGTEDFRDVIEDEYKLLKEEDRKEGKRLAHLKAMREKEKKGF